jgi:hypothetical protein
VGVLLPIVTSSRDMDVLSAVHEEGNVPLTGVFTTASFFSDGLLPQSDGNAPDIFVSEMQSLTALGNVQLAGMLPATRQPLLHLSGTTSTHALQQHIMTYSTQLAIQLKAFHIAALPDSMDALRSSSTWVLQLPQAAGSVPVTPGALIESAVMGSRPYDSGRVPPMMVCPPRYSSFRYATVASWLGSAAI